MPDPIVKFLAALAGTIALVGVTAVLGWLARRRPHLASAAVTAVALFYSIYLAERLGQEVRLVGGLPKAVHLSFANLAAVTFILVVVSGTRLYRREEGGRRRLHRRAVVTFVALALAATATGLYWLAASPGARLSETGSSPASVPAATAP